MKRGELRARSSAAAKMVSSAAGRLVRAVMSTSLTRMNKRGGKRTTLFYTPKNVDSQGGIVS